MVYEQSLVLSKILTGEKKNAPLLRKASFHLDAHVCMVQKKKIIWKQAEEKLKDLIRIQVVHKASTWKKSQKRGHSSK